MKDHEKGPYMREQQEKSLSARKALDRNNPVLALTIIEQIPVFLPLNLTTVMAIISFQAKGKDLRARAMSLFHAYLSLCTNPNALQEAGIWVRRSIRCRFIPDELVDCIDARRIELDPDWDGIWRDTSVVGSIAGSKDMEAQRQMKPEEVEDTEVCLNIASQTGRWFKWMDRYIELGGDPQNPKYLKIWVSKGVSRDKKPSQIMIKMLKLFVEFGHISEVRAFLRHITPVDRPHGKKVPNSEMAKYALLLYCGCKRLEHAVDDWVHISESASYLGLPIIERIVQRILGGLVGTPAARKAFDRLTLRQGKIEVTSHQIDDIGQRGSPIRDILDAYVSDVGADAAASDIMVAYSQYMTRNNSGGA